MSELLELPSESQLPLTDLSVTEQDMIAMFQRFITLQDQFTQLTQYVEQAFERINSLEAVVHRNILK